jgi:hypothetical protein
MGHHGTADFLCEIGFFHESEERMEVSEFG